MKAGIVLILWLPIFCFKLVSGQATDYLHVPGPIVFEKTMYGLAWTIHPEANFYKQEYVAKGDSVTRFKNMILLDFRCDAKIKDMVDEKVAELKKLKKNNPVVNYQVMENKGEYMLDFLLSENSADGQKINMVERNVYRYKSINKAGQKGVLLFGVSNRFYGDESDKFFSEFKDKRYYLINAVGAFDMPEIKPVK